MNIKKIAWTKIGVCSVDSGTLLLGDPCYWMSKEDYDRYLLEEHFDTNKQIDHGMGNSGKGVLVSSGYGDGVYPVYVTFKDGRIKAVKVEFF